MFFIKNMQKAIDLIEKSGSEVPVACIITDKNTNKIISLSINSMEKEKNPLAHAEMNAIKFASEIESKKYFLDYDIYITLQPCEMCMHAIRLKRFNRVFFGSYRDEFLRLDENVFGGILVETCDSVLDCFFKKIRS